MLSDSFRNLEDLVGKTQILQEELVAELVTKLGKESSLIERALYLTGVSSGAKPFDMAFIILEFLINLHEQNKENISDEQ